MQNDLNISPVRHTQERMQGGRETEMGRKGEKKNSVCKQVVCSCYANSQDKTLDDPRKNRCADNVGVPVWTKNSKVSHDPNKYTRH